MNYLTPCTFDFGALAQLPKVLKDLGVTRPFVVTDPGLKANGLLDRLLAALGARARRRIHRHALQSDGSGGARGVGSVPRGRRRRHRRARRRLFDGSRQRRRPDGHARGSVRPLRRHASAACLIGKIPPLVADPDDSRHGQRSLGRRSSSILDSGRKETFVSPHLIPRAAICDPELTLGLPPQLTAATGMDAMTHCIEVGALAGRASASGSHRPRWRRARIGKWLSAPWRTGATATRAGT